VSTSQPDPVVVASQVPTHWYNLAADLPEPTPPATDTQPDQPTDAQDADAQDTDQG
jgi:tryptophan synthase beta chain